MEEKFYHSVVLRNLSNGFSFPWGGLDFPKKGVIYLNRLGKLFDKIQMENMSVWRGQGFQGTSLCLEITVHESKS